MKKYFLIFIFALIFIPNLFNPFSFAGDELNFNEFNAQTIYNNSDEIITNFSSEIFVNKDNSIDVIEKITYDFKDLQKHGMYRFIPLNKPAGAVRNLRITDVSVTNEKGIPYNFEKTNSNEFNLKIGDADKIITGEHVYVIKYKVVNPIGYFNDYDEIYWNVTGNDWEVPILNSTSSIYLPGDLTKSKLLIASYCDYLGQNQSCVNSNAVYDAINDQTIINFTTPKDFYYDSGYGMTVAVGFPKGIIDPVILKWYEKPTTYIYMIYGVSFIFILLFMHLIFIKFLPEYRNKKRPIVAQFDPPQDILPSQAGMIYNLFGINNGVILSADILYLASLGCIKIESKPKDTISKKLSKIESIFKIVFPLFMFGLVFSIFFSFKFFVIVLFIFSIIKRKIIKNMIQSIQNPVEFYITRIKDPDLTDISTNLKLLLNLISKQDQTISLSDVEKERNYNSFQNYINQTKESVEQKDIETKIKKIVFTKIIRFFFVAFFALTIFGVILFFALMIEDVGIDSFPIQALFFIFTLAGAVVLYRTTKSITKWILSKMTESWYLVAGLHRYIKIAEKNRIEFESNPHKAEQIFSSLLPYAVAFGLEDKWIHVFDGIMINPPDWYSGGSIHTMSSSIGAFAGAMTSTSNAGAPVSSSLGGGGSSGGGSSGGGGGGGGGGSW